MTKAASGVPDSQRRRAIAAPPKETVRGCGSYGREEQGAGKRAHVINPTARRAHSAHTRPAVGRNSASNVPDTGAQLTGVGT